MGPSAFARALSVRVGALALLALLFASCEQGGEGSPPTATGGRAGVVTASRGGSPLAQPAPPAADAPPVDAAPAAPTEGASDRAEEGMNDRAELPIDCPPPEALLDPVQILRFEFTSAVESKKATDKLGVARPGQRVWAHLTVRNRTGRTRCLRLSFRVGGKERTSVVLEVGHSWSWRTWAYNTLRDTDRSGRLELEITDERGKRIMLESLPIVPEPRG